GPQVRGRRGILPVHQVGVSGHFRAYVEGDRQIELVGSIGNGRGNFTDDVQETDETNVFKALLFRIGFKGFGARDLELGVSGLFDRIAPVAGLSSDPTAFVRPALPDQSIDEAIGNAYLAYRGVDLTVISEAFDVYHAASTRDAAGVNRWYTIDAYALGAYRIGEVSPYLMTELRRTSADHDRLLEELLRTDRRPALGLHHLERPQAGVPPGAAARPEQHDAHRHHRLVLRPLTGP